MFLSFNAKQEFRFHDANVRLEQHFVFNELKSFNGQAFMHFLTFILYCDHQDIVDSYLHIRVYILFSHVNVKQTNIA